MSLQIKSSTKQINIVLFTLLFFAVVTSIYNAKTRNDLTVSKKHETSNIIQIQENDKTPTDQKEDIKVGSKSNFTIYDNKYSILGENTRFDKEVIDTNIPFLSRKYYTVDYDKKVDSTIKYGRGKIYIIEYDKRTNSVEEKQFYIKSFVDTLIASGYSLVSGANWLTSDIDKVDVLGYQLDISLEKDNYLVSITSFGRYVNTVITTKELKEEYNKIKEEMVEVDNKTILDFYLTPSFN